MGFNVKAYKDAMCNSAVGCYNYGSKPDTKGAVKATAWIIGDQPPKIGDSVDIFDDEAPGTPATVTLTADNYATSLYDWAKLKAFNCFDGDFYKDMYFFPQDPNKGLQNGTRPMWETELEKVDDEELASPIGYKNTTKYNLNLLENQEWLNNLLAKKARVSIIDFLDNGVQVLPYGTGKNYFENVIKKGGFALDDPKTTISGSVEIFHRGKRQPVFYKTDDATYSEKIQKVAEYTFDRTSPTITGITAVGTCGGKSACLKYEVAQGTAFTFKLAPLEAAISTCFVTKVLDGCGDALTGVALSTVTVDGTGLVTCTGISTVGDYTFTVVFENECCVSGSICFSVRVFPD